MTLIVQIWLKPEYRATEKQSFIFLKVMDLEFEDLIEAMDRDFVIEGEHLHAHWTDQHSVRRIRARDKIVMRGGSIGRITIPDCSFVDGDAA